MRARARVFPSFSSLFLPSSCVLRYFSLTSSCANSSSPSSKEDSKFSERGSFLVWANRIVAISPHQAPLLFTPMKLILGEPLFAARDLRRHKKGPFIGVCSLHDSKKRVRLVSVVGARNLIRVSDACESAPAISCASCVGPGRYPGAGRTSRRSFAL